MSSRILTRGAGAVQPVPWEQVAPDRAVPWVSALPELDAVASPGSPVEERLAAAQPSEKAEETVAAPAPVDVVAPWRERCETLERQLEQWQQQLPNQLREARAQGSAEGQQAATGKLQRQVDEAEQRLARLTEEVTRLKPQWRHEAEQDLVRLALAIARKVLHREAAVDPDVIVTLVRVALERLRGADVTRVRCAPMDVDRVREILQRHTTAEVDVVADASLGPCGLAMETLRGTVDASLGTQLVEIERGLTDLLARKAG